MPIPKCSPTEVYHKASKKCVEVGGENYKSIVSKNANTFKSYLKKIEKILKKKNRVCPKPNQVYSKKSKKCITINGPAYKKQIKEEPTAFFQPKTSFKLKYDICKNDEVFNFFSTRCVKIGGQAYKAALKKDPTIFNDFKEKIKVIENSKKTPVKPITSMKVSQLAKQLFMKKAKKILRNADNKSVIALRQIDKYKIPKYILIKKMTEINLYYLNYFPNKGNNNNNNEISDLTFKKNKKLKRDIVTIKFYRDNISTYFYKYILKSNINTEIIDVNWFIDMQSYIKNLSDRQRYALASYTEYGDVYINLLERGLTIDYSRIKLEPLFYEFIVYMANPNNPRENIFRLENVIPTVSYLMSTSHVKYNYYIDDSSGKLLSKLYTRFITYMRNDNFTNIFLFKLIRNLADTISSTIKKAPPTKKPMVVFRGVKDSFFTADNFSNPPKMNEVYYNKGFVSTTLQYNLAIRTFANIEKGCCFKVITILPGTRCIPLIGLTHFSSEFEILLDRNVKFIIRDKYEARIPLRGKINLLNNGDKIKMKISDIIIG